MIADGIIMEKTSTPDVESAPAFDGRVLDGLNGVDRELMERINSFLRTHVLKVDLSEGRGGGGGGGGGSKGGIGGKNKIKRELPLFSIFFNSIRSTLAPLPMYSLHFRALLL